MLFCNPVTPNLLAALFSVVGVGAPTAAPLHAEPVAGDVAVDVRSVSMDPQFVCKYDQPALALNDGWVDDQLRIHVLGDLQYVDADTDYNNRWVQATGIWTIEGGVRVDFDWAIQQRQDFPGGWYGPTGDGWAEVNIWIDESRLYVEMRQIELSNDLVYGWIADMFGLNNLAFDALNSILWSTFGYGTPVEALFGEYAAPTIATYGVDQAWAAQVVEALGKSHLWMRIGDAATYFGISNWDAAASGVAGTPQAAQAFANAAASMCP
ncbi:hypothetical protein [Nannocystis radixulma]|uniref:Uncharacterized protein n=1 Tax=Nannocystis radixulma TaxID=2995305 RepID=A0ABT5B0V9_9BACT|nr:hypothetical protein [Nannocystis radixulma]MDC0667383.1 hypothetical protein [Nannocystis radixulma]